MPSNLPTPIRYRYPWTFPSESLRSRLTITTRFTVLYTDAVKDAVDEFLTDNEDRVREHIAHYTFWTHHTPQEIASGEYSDLLSSLGWIPQYLDELPDDDFEGYFRTTQPNGTTEWEFNTTHGRGEDNCGTLMYAVATVYAIPEVAQVAGVLSVTAR